MRVTVRVQGLRELDEALGELPKATAKNVLRRVLLRAGEPIEKAAAAGAPKLSGNLSRRIDTGTQLTKRQRKQAEREGIVEVFVGVTRSLPEGHMQEFGTAHHAPQAFLRPAWDANKGRAIEIIKNDLAGEIEKARQRLARKAARLAARSR